MLKLTNGGRFSSLRVAVPTLLALVLALTGILFLSLERWYSTVAEALLGDQPPTISSSDLIRLALTAMLVAATAGVSALLVQGYRKAQRDLARVQLLSRNILENMVGGVIAFDTKGHMIVANPAARRMLELPQAHVDDGLDLLGVKQPDMAQLVRSALREKLYVQDRDFAYTRSSKQQTCLRVATCPLLANEGKWEGIVVLVKDVTGLVRMEQRFRQLDRQAVTETMAAGVAHEVRNPLSAISLYLRLLKEEVLPEGRNPQAIQEYLEILDAETRRLNRITEEFLTVSRPAHLVRRKFLVGEVIDRVQRLLQAEAAEKSVSLRVARPSPTLEVFGDPERLEQVFLNVLVNALEATTGKGEIDIWAKAVDLEEAGLVEIGVRDDGVGIAPECLPRLFDPYFTTKANGTGLGLAIAHRMISDHGGEIRIESEPGAGTTVRITLPMEAPEWQSPPMAGI